MRGQSLNFPPSVRSRASSTSSSPWLVSRGLFSDITSSWLVGAERRPGPTPQGAGVRPCFNRTHTNPSTRQTKAATVAPLCSRDRASDVNGRSGPDPARDPGLGRDNKADRSRAISRRSTGAFQSWVRRNIRPAPRSNRWDRDGPGFRIKRRGPRAPGSQGPRVPGLRSIRPTNRRQRRPNTPSPMPFIEGFVSEVVVEARVERDIFGHIFLLVDRNLERAPP